MKSFKSFSSSSTLLKPAGREPRGLRAGFTLTELLVVIAIVIALAALGFSLGGKAVDAAKSAKNVNNLRQISVVLNEIIEEGVHSGGNTPPGTFPPYAGQISAPSSWRKFNLIELLGEKAGLCAFDGNKYEWSTLPSETFLQNPNSKHRLGEEFGGLKQINLSSRPRPIGSYAYNHLLGDWRSANSEIKFVTRRAEVFDPSAMIIMAEQSIVADDGAIWMGPYYPSRTPSGPYKDSAHCLFVDGHVAIIKNEEFSDQTFRDRHLNPRKDTYK